MDLAATVLAALVALHPGPGGTDETRRAAVEGIVAAATERPLWKPAEGADGSAEVLATALFLAGIGQHESSFDPRVGDCRVRGNGAVTYFQLLGSWAYDGHAEKEICASPALAAKLALRVLHHHKTRCKGCAPSSWLAAYASGNPGKPSRASRDTGKVVERLAKLAHLTLTLHGAKGPAWEPGFPAKAEP